jgi:hypothetical protein
MAMENPPDDVLQMIYPMKIPCLMTEKISASYKPCFITFSMGFDDRKKMTTTSPCHSERCLERWTDHRSTFIFRVNAWLVSIKNNWLVNIKLYSNLPI